MHSKFKGIALCIVILEFFVLCMSAVPEQIIVKMTRTDVFDAINSVMKSSYIRQLTKEFASRAAERFIDEIKRRQFLGDLHRQSPGGSRLGRNLNPLEMDMSEIADVITHLMKSSYMKQILKELVGDVAERFTDEVYERHILGNLVRYEKQNKRAGERMENLYEETSTRVPEILDEAKAKLLLERPYMDGDNLDPMAEQTLSDAEINDIKPKSITKLTRINGAYFRRLLGYLIRNEEFLKEIEA